jgi:hypothetical protein
MSVEYGEEVRDIESTSREINQEPRRYYGYVKNV